MKSNDIFCAFNAVVNLSLEFCWSEILFCISNYATFYSKYYILLLAKSYIYKITSPAPLLLHYAVPKWFWLNLRREEQQNSRHWQPTSHDERSKTREILTHFLFFLNLAVTGAANVFTVLPPSPFFVVRHTKPKSCLRCPFGSEIPLDLNQDCKGLMQCLFRQDLTTQD